MEIKMKRRILLVTVDGLEVGGIRSVIMNIVRNLSDEYTFDLILSIRGEKKYEREFISYGGKIFNLNIYIGDSNFRKIVSYCLSRWLGIFIGTLNVLKRNLPYDAIHCHNSFESGICNFAAMISGVNVRIAHSHGCPNKVDMRRVIYDGILKILIDRFSYVKIGCSANANKYMFGSSKHTKVINNAIDLAKFNRQNYPDNVCNSMRFIHVGVFTRNKNQLFVLDVFAQIARRIATAELVLIGKEMDEYAKDIINKIEYEGIKECVKILPHDSDIALELSYARYMIFPSIHEGLPISLIESQAMGVECFVSDSITKESDLGLCHYLSLEDGSTTWAEYIIQVIEDNVEEKRCIDSSSFDIRNVIEEYRKVYNG